MVGDLGDITRRSFLGGIGALLLAGNSSCKGLEWDIFYGGFELQEEADAKKIEIANKLQEYEPWIKVKEINGNFYVVADVDMYGRDAKKLRDKHRLILKDENIQMVSTTLENLDDVVVSSLELPELKPIQNSDIMEKNEREVYLILKNLIEKTGFNYEYLPLFMAWIEHESNGFQPHIVSSAGAVGYTQLMPIIAKHYGLKVCKECGTSKQKLEELAEKYKENPKELWDKDQRFHPTYNIYAGLMFLNHLCHKYGTETEITDDALKIALMAYNTGEPNIDKVIKATGSKDVNIIKRHPKIVKQARDYPGLIMSKIPKFVERITKYEKSLKIPT